MEILTKNARETQRVGKAFAAGLKGGEILALVGNLGSGKTTFIQGLAEGLGIKKKVISPTFILVREYRGKFYHIDLYRLENNVVQELRNLGIAEIWGRKGNIVAIEWAEKVKELLPKSVIWIVFEDLGGDKRRIIVT